MTSATDRFFSRPFRRLLLKICLIGLPIFVVIGVDVFLLPVDYFAFRNWEALAATQGIGIRYLLPGPLYPGMSLSKIERFDLALNAPDAIRSLASWQTDRFGYRKHDDAGRRDPIVIVGDSSTIGTGLDQQEILSEVLESMLGAGVYPYAVSSVSSLLHDVRFVDDPPRVVVLAVTERLIPSVAEVPMTLATMGEPEKSLRRMLQRVQQVRLVQKTAICVDRALKLAPLHYVRARLARDAKTRFTSPLHPRMLFLQGAAAFQPVPQEVLARCIRTLTGIRAVLEARGIRFIFLPIPNKENIYYRMLGAAQQPVFLSQLVRALRAEGVTAVDSQTAFNDVYVAGGEELYQIEDSHWNAAGVRVAARRLAEAIKSKDWIQGVK